MPDSLITTQDGQQISARFFHPQGQSRGAVLIAPAMGVSQDYYAPFASWLAAQGFTTATFDYRGTGLSRPRTLRGFDADILDWARLDCAAMVDALPQRPLYWIGHSLGGQILAMVPNNKAVTKAITIATGSGYWLQNVPSLRLKVWWLWFVIVPLALPLFGYFPGRALRKVGDLPKGVMAQWRRWCLNSEYAVGVEGDAVRAAYAAVRAPIVSLSFADDEMMSAANTESIHGFYSGAPRTMKRIAPQDIGAKRIGHFGFFRAAFESSLWRGHVLPELR
ncbi:MAG TPA: alpha/beta fold hydrolase [Burkholderiales bacterium]|nr:alpha/beta fold hydrolase [Burkholderiales bacterium]